METAEKTVSLVVVRETRRKTLVRQKDGHEYDVVDLLVKGSKGEFVASSYLDIGQVIETGKEKIFKIKKARTGNGWVIQEVKEKKAFSPGGFAPRPPEQAIHAAALIVAKDLLLAGKLDDPLNDPEEAILHAARSIASAMLSHHRSTTTR